MNNKNVIFGIYHTSSLINKPDALINKCHNKATCHAGRVNHFSRVAPEGRYLDEKNHNNGFRSSASNNESPMEFVVPDESTGIKPFAKTPENEEEVMFELYRRIGRVINKHKDKYGIESLIEVVNLLEVLTGNVPEE